jgi:hypothetical protein
LGAVEIRVAKALQKSRLRLENSSGMVDRRATENAAKVMNDPITSKVLLAIADEEFGEPVPEYFRITADAASFLKLPDEWEFESLEHVVLHPAGRLIKSMGYQLEVDDNGNLIGSSVDLVNHQRKYFLEYSKTYHEQVIRYWSVISEYGATGRPASGTQAILEADPVLIELDNRMRQMNSDYYAELLRLVRYEN